MSPGKSVSPRQRWGWVACWGAIVILAACDLERVLSDNTCRMRMIDIDNGIDTTLQVKEINTSSFIVTEGITSSNPWSVEVNVDSDQQIKINDGIPQITVNELLRQYVMKDNQHLTFMPIVGHSCTTFETSLIYFLIMEWFYFG